MPQASPAPPPQRQLDKPSWLFSKRLVKSERISVFLRGSSTSNEITQILKDLHDLKKPISRYLPERLDKNPTQGTESIETICEKNGASMFGFGSSTKRRPNHLILGRLYNGKVLDLFEFHASQGPARDMKERKSSIIGSTPCFIFLGQSWSRDNSLSEFKNYMLDGFGVRAGKQLDLRAVERAIVCSAFNASTIEIRHFFIERRVVIRPSWKPPPQTSLPAQLHPVRLERRLGGWLVWEGEGTGRRCRRWRGAGAS